MQHLLRSGGGNAGTQACSCHASGASSSSSQPTIASSSSSRPRHSSARVVRGLVSSGRVLAPLAAAGAAGRDSPCDLILSSGFLSFASHSGFLEAVEQAGLHVSGLMGTSAGALAGSLYCAGYTPRQVAAHLSREPPIALLRPSLEPWRGGVLSLDGVVERLRELLPPTFEDLEKEFAVGVMTSDGQHLLIDRGPLPEAVAASAAIPFLFQAVDIPGHGRRNPFKDGGCVDRVGLRAWRDRRHAQAAAQGGQARVPAALVHVISRSSPFSGHDNVAAWQEQDVVVVHSPQSGVSLFNLGDFEQHMAASTLRAQPAMREAAAAAERRRRGGGAGGSGGGSSSGGSSSGSSNGSSHQAPQVAAAGHSAAQQKQLQHAGAGAGAA